MHVFSWLISSESGSGPASRTGRWMLVQLCSSHLLRLAFLDVFVSGVNTVDFQSRYLGVLIG